MNKRNSKDVKSANSAQPPQRSRFLVVALVGVSVGLLIVAVASWLTPLPDDETLMAEAAQEAGGKLPATKPALEVTKTDPKAKLDETDQVSAASPSASLQIQATKSAFTPLQLPSTPEPMQVATLQEELRGLADRLTIEYPDDIASYHFAAQAYSELKQSEKAEELWSKCIAQSPEHMGPYVGFATMLMEKGRNEEAVKILTKAQELGGSSPEMLEKLGEAYENLGDLPNAFESLKRGTTSYPEVASLWLLLGRIQNQMGEASDAELSLRKSIDLGGDKEAALIVLNAALVRQRKTTEANANREELAKLKQSRGAQPDTFQDSYDQALRRIASDVFASAGTLAETHDKLDAAEKLYLRAASLNPRNPDAYRGLLAVCRREQRFIDQKTLLSKLIELRPGDIIARTNLASVVLQLGDPALAELTLKQAIAIDPQGVLAQAAIVKLYLSTGNLADARLLAAQVVERQPSSASYRLLAATYQASGFEEAFVAANKKADELAGTDATAPK